MREDRFQHDFVMWFRQKWPEYSHSLFMIHNEAKSKKEASYLKSMGLVSGASDFGFIMPRHGKYIGLELKAPGSRHSKEHIEKQINWGEQLMKNNGYYIMTSDMDTLKEFCTALVDYDIISAISIQCDALSYVKKQFVNKTIKF